MKIVKSLNEINECPDCGSTYYFKKIKSGLGLSCVHCINCHEEFYEDKTACYDVGNAPDDIDDSLMEIEYAVSDLTRYATTQHELEQMERIRDIFDELISIIRRMK